MVAFPFAYYMARVASPRTRTVLFMAMLMPLWANYLVQVYAWKIILTRGGPLGRGRLNVHVIYRTGSSTPSSATCGCRT